MGSRSGDLDSSVITYLMKKENLTEDDMTEILNKRSGLYGISEISIDMRDVEAEALSGGRKAKISMDVFHYQVAAYIVKCAVAMGGIDVLTFTAGIGEKGAISRKSICNYLKFLGLEIDENINNKLRNQEKEISTKESKIKVYVVPTNEELMIARKTMELVK